MRLLILVWSLKKLGFQIVNTPEEADVVILESNRFDASIFGQENQPLSMLRSGKPMIEKFGKLGGFLQDLERLKN